LHCSKWLKGLVLSGLVQSDLSK